MNKVDAFGVMASLLLVWFFCIYLLPSTFMMFVYASIASWTVGTSIGRLPGRLSKETDGDYLDEMLKLLNAKNKTICEIHGLLIRSDNANQSQSARIDELMFEYCPEDMTPEQIANYEAHQKVVEVNRELH